MDGRIIDYLMQKLILAATARSALRGDIPVAITGAVAFTMTLVSIAFSLKTPVAIPSSSASRSPSSSMSGGHRVRLVRSPLPLLSDKAAHIISSSTIAVLGLLIVLLHRRLNRMHCAVRVITLLTLIFTLELGAVREVIEFSIDHLFEAQLEDGLDDTMYGLIFADVGAALSPAPA